MVLVLVVDRLLQGVTPVHSMVCAACHAHHHCMPHCRVGVTTACHPLQGELAGLRVGEAPIHSMAYTAHHAHHHCMLHCRVGVTTACYHCRVN